MNKRQENNCLEIPQRQLFNRRALSVHEGGKQSQGSACTPELSTVHEFRNYCHPCDRVYTIFSIRLEQVQEDTHTQKTNVYCWCSLLSLRPTEAPQRAIARTRQFCRHKEERSPPFASPQTKLARENQIKPWESHKSGQNSGRNSGQRTAQRSHLSVVSHLLKNLRAQKNLNFSWLGKHSGDL